MPEYLHDAMRLWDGSQFAREAFGEEVVAHYSNMARVELEQFGRAITDWERFRSFERM